MGTNKETMATNSRLQQVLYCSGFLALLYFMLTVAQISRDTIISLPYSDHHGSSTRKLQSTETINLVALPVNSDTNVSVTNYSDTNQQLCNCNCSCCAANGLIPVADQGTNLTIQNNPKPQKPKPAKKPKQLATIPQTVQKELLKYTVIRSLKNYSLELYERTKAAVSLINVTQRVGKVPAYQKANVVAKHSLGISNFVFNSKLTICNSEVSDKTHLVLFTTMFHSDTKQYLFNNTLTNYAVLKPTILPVLFISDMNIVEKSGYLIERACKLGWTVSAAPRRTQFGYPILNSMYFHTMRLYPTTSWIGYANADVMFTARLPAVLDFIHTTPSMANFTFISSRRTNVYIPPGTNLNTLTEVNNLTKTPTAKVHSEFAIDYFIYKRDAPVLTNMPDFCIGRRGYDNWLLFYQTLKQIPSLDVTAASPAVHVGIEGASFKANSHNAQVAEKDYNIPLATGQNWFLGGLTSCLSHGLKYTPSKDKASNTGTFELVGPSSRRCPVHLEQGVLVKNSRRKPKAQLLK